jgi:hypothetical protein
MQEIFFPVDSSQSIGYVTSVKTNSYERHKTYQEMNYSLTFQPRAIQKVFPLFMIKLVYSLVHRRFNNTHMAYIPYHTKFKLKKYIIFFIIWFVRLLALRPLLAYCASLG